MNALNALILAAESGDEGGGGLSLILPEAAELVYGAISFLIVYFILSRYAFPRINQLLEDRQASIQGRMEEAEQQLADARQTREQYQAQLDDAKGESNRIIEEAKSTAESLRRDIVAKAEAEAKAIVDRAQRDVAAERDRALQELRSEVGALSVRLASRIVERELDASTHEDLVDQYIQELSNSN